MQHARAVGHLPFACKCGQFFSRKDSLKRLVRTMALGEDPEPCPPCPMSFKRPDYVLQHLRTHHRVHPQSLGQFKKPRARNTRAPSLAGDPVSGSSGMPLAAGASPNMLPATYKGSFDMSLPGDSDIVVSLAQAPVGTGHNGSYEMPLVGGYFDVLPALPEETTCLVLGTVTWCCRSKTFSTGSPLRDFDEGARRGPSKLPCLMGFHIEYRLRSVVPLHLASRFAVWLSSSNLRCLAS
jgi:hypothetical protein